MQKEYANRIGLTAVGPLLVLLLGVFLFFIFKKIQNFKNIRWFQEISKMDPCRPWGGDRDLFVIFFSSNRSLAGDVVQGAGRPPHGRQGRAALFKPPSPLTPHSIL